jgi:hypothetical protein
MFLSSISKPEPEEDFAMASGTNKPNSHLRANFCYALATCAMGGVGWFVWSNLNQPPAPPLPAEAQPVASVEDLLRTPSGSAATTPPTLVTAPPTPRPTRAKSSHGNQHVRGGITIVGPAGTTSTVAPPTKNDLGAPTPEANVTSTLISAPANATPAANEPPGAGPKFYSAPPVGPSSSSNSSPSGALRFYSFDANVPSAIQKLNRGESADKWQTRVTVHPNN